MKVLLIKKDKIRNFILPNKVFGNMWLTSFDENGNEKNIINIQATNDGKWEIVSNNEFYVIENSKRTPYVILEENTFLMIKEAFTDNNFFIYISPTYEDSMKFYSASSALVTGITVGKKAESKILYNLPLISDEHAQIVLKGNDIIVTDLNTNYGTYINNAKITTPTKLNFGDIMFIMGLRIIILRYDGSYVIGVNNPKNLVTVNLQEVKIDINVNQKFEESVEEKDMQLYTDDDYFHKKPRFIYSVKKLDLKIDAPPAKSNKQETPLIITLGPMMTMSLTSVVMIYTTVNNVMYGDSTWEESIPALVTSGVMMISFLLWPAVTNLFQRKMEKKKEKNRQNKYSEYVESKTKKIEEEKNIQSEILSKRYPSLQECEQIILNKDDRLWEKRVEDDDFFTASLGTGSIPMEIDITFPDDHFSLDEDNLKLDLKKLEQADKSLKDVPIPFSFNADYISALIGKEKLTKQAIRNILLQLITFHSYDNLKIAIFTSKEMEDNWTSFKCLPHCFSNDKVIRYFASDNDEYKELTYNLERVFNQRKENFKESSNKNTLYNPVYLIITDSFNSIRNYDFIKNIIESKNNFGFSIMILNEKISNLPEQCQTFIELDEEEAHIFKNIANNEKQKFKIDNVIFNIDKCIKNLANIPIEINSDNEGAIPKKVGFMEMYDVGKVEQLNCIGRWSKNVPISNMEAVVGLGKNGEKISLDLHEKFHGPHGLIAGMTGSGKSEFIITYILSMAINYHPDEVQFILIDYKGGGLAGAFENKNLGIKLPHLVGVITNLDKNDMNRSLASIESELKRRQALFNKAREISGESTIDIYKYQKMYRNKIVKEPVSHLLIIADEFAELKTQQPEFMDQLISTARIGRSLGVHLILATQKPSGVVDSQIWSNTRFRVCLRVQEKSDSSEVIQCPDAAYLTQTGRFYLQVGFNEIFVLGQSAWAGGKYIPSETIQKTIDSSMNFINNTGYVVKTVETKEKNVEVDESKGEELINLVQYMSKCAEEENIKTTPLWLEKIPAQIYVSNLMKKYKYTKENYMLNPIIGEYDVPNMQQQHLLTMPFYNEGNAIIYGMAGSGKENFITTMIYSSMVAYSAEEINFYILDFGAEILRYFNTSPIVGDIVFIDEAEKVKNLFKMVSDKIDERKKLFSNYNGDYSNYCKNSRKGVPNIVVVINNYEAYAETYPDYEELLIVLTRDCIKYGIYFVTTCNTPDGMRFKLKQNFGQSFVLQQNNEDDYTAILGNVHKNYPSKIFGRGLIRKTDVYEFQTALAAESNKISESVKYLSEKLKTIYNTRAEKIPILPETVVYEELDVKNNDNSVVIGVDKSELNICNYDFSKNHINIITGTDFSNLELFASPFLLQHVYKENINTVVINAEDISVNELVKTNLQYVDSNFDEIFDSLIGYLEECDKKYKESNFDKNVFSNQKYYRCIIVGINSFKNKLSPDKQTDFSKLFSTSSELGILDFIFIDSIDKIKNFEFEGWYKSYQNKNEGIWLGSGFSDQYTINVTKRIPEAKEELPNNFCFVVTRGKPSVVKYVEFIKSDRSI